jgi:hypothetical protein
MLNRIGAGLGDARRFKEATLAVTRLWNDLRLAHGCKDRAEEPVLNDRCQRHRERFQQYTRADPEYVGVGLCVFRS